MIYALITAPFLLAVMLVTRKRTTGRTAWMCLGTGIANGFMKLGCLTEAGFKAVEISASKFVELYRANKAAQGL